VVHHYFEDCIYYTPMHSDVEGGRFHMRLPPNIRTGRWAWPRRGGWPVKLGRDVVLAALQRDLQRKPQAM
ncbi:MAG: phytanoyl-CoA dioxygenase, partial [Phenylobacterium zucineum]